MKNFINGFLMSLLVVMVSVLIIHWIERDYLKIGFSLAGGWYLGKAIFLVIGHRINQLLIKGCDFIRDRYYQWKEKQGYGD